MKHLKDITDWKECINEVVCGDSISVLKKLPDECVNCVVTSPPYWALRDYGVAGQLGLEATFQEYVNKLCDIFDEVKRILKKDGTCWVNIGDTFLRGNRLKDGNEQSLRKRPKNTSEPITKPDYGADKCLAQIPAIFSIEMCNRGWILRNEIIWHKPSCMPESVKDRFTVDFEKIFFFVKNKDYYFEQQFEAQKDWGTRNREGGKYKKEGLANGLAGNLNPNGRNKRCVWSINPKGYKEAHFATYPEKLCETPIRAGCPKGGIVLDPFFGSGTTGRVAKDNSRDFIGIELNPEYCKLAEKRLAQEVLF